MKEKVKVLIVADCPTVKTGFSRVIHEIFNPIEQEKFDIHILGINYYGDSHELQQRYKLYPAASKGDLWGMGRIVELIQNIKPSIVYILNDVWVVAKYLEILKNSKITLPKIVVYYPIDSIYLNPDWFKDFDIVTKNYTYTRFGKIEVDLVAPEVECGIIPHGTNIDVFYKLPYTKQEIRKAIFSDDKGNIRDDFLNGWFVFSTNRNQPRKRLDLLLQGFSLFAENKPSNVRIYLNCGLKDAGISIIQFARRYGIENRLHITNKAMGIQQIPDEKLNLLYNMVDVGTNVSWGEGFGLCNTEHAATGVCQIVADHSSLHELFQDCGILIPATFPNPNIEMDTIGFLPTIEAIAEKLEFAYQNQDLVKELGEKSRIKFTSPEYQWSTISKTWENIFNSIL